MRWIEKLLFPPSCQLCSAPADDEELCQDCATEIHAVGLACPLCALPNETGEVCQTCTHQPPVWQSAQSLFVYDGSVRDLMHLWKYQPRPSAGRLLSDRMENWLQQQTLPEVDAVLAIPMHPKKLAQRGFNTAYQLARLVAETQSLPLLHHALVRQFATPAQAGLSKQARQQNLLGVFRVDTQRMMGYQRILLVDDVLTTGSTLTACTQLLHTAGVREIAVLTLARALPKNDVTAV